MITCSQSNLNSIDKSSPSNYKLVFPKIPTETSVSVNNPFIMNIHSAILPSVSIAQNDDLRWQGNKTLRGTLPMEFDSWLVSFVVDSLFANWKLLFNWMSYINNNNDKIAEYHNNHSVDCSLIVTDNYNTSILEVIFVSVWPGTLGEVSFSQREGDILLESTINFNYDRFYIRQTGWTDDPIFGFSSSSSSSSTSSSSSSTSSS